MAGSRQHCCPAVRNFILYNLGHNLQGALFDALGDAHDQLTIRHIGSHIVGRAADAGRRNRQYQHVHTGYRFLQIVGNPDRFRNLNSRKFSHQLPVL